MNNQQSRRTHRDRSRVNSSRDFDEKYNDSTITNRVLGIQKRLQSHQARLIACNGDCGSTIALIINDCVHPQTKHDGTQVTQVTDKQISKSISDALWLYNYPLRKELVDLMGKKESYRENEQLLQIYKSLKNPSCYIQGDIWRIQIIELFKALSVNHMDVLHDLANKSCVQPDYSISQEVEQFYERQKEILWKQVAIKNVYISQHAMLLNVNYDKNMKLIESLNKEKKKLMKELDDLQEKTTSIIDETSYELQIETVKKHPNYLEMQKRNMPLSNQEILAIIVFCKYEKLCSGMRDSHRFENLNSCQWKKLFHHLCCGLYKICMILHHENDAFYKQYIEEDEIKKNNFLFRGIRGVESVKSVHEMHTVTSFSYDFNVALHEFAAPNGLILVIKNAYQAMYDGRLFAASVSWISPFKQEHEFILLPTTLRNIRFINSTQITEDDPYFHFIYNPDAINIYEAMDYFCVDLKPVIWSVSKRRQPPIMWLGDKSPEYIERKKQSATAWIILCGGFFTWQCPICKVKARLCEYSGNLLDMSVECPSCRSLFLQFGDSNPDELECYNLKCGTIRHKDLEKVVDDEKDEWSQMYSMGYKCRKCGKRQREAQFERYKDDAFMEDAATKYIDAVEKEFKNINIKKDKQKVKEMILFIMNPKKNKAYIDEIILKFPVVWEWLLQIPEVREGIEKNKDEIAKVAIEALGLPKYLAPVASGAMQKDVNKTIKSAKKAVKKEWKNIFGKK